MREFLGGMEENIAPPTIGHCDLPSRQIEDSLPFYLIACVSLWFYTFVPVPNQSLWSKGTVNWHAAWPPLICLWAYTGCTVLHDAYCRLFFNGFRAGLSSRRVPRFWVLKENLSFSPPFFEFFHIFLLIKSCLLWVFGQKWLWFFAQRAKIEFFS